jgi:tRNA(fMet)-specific endonuclease VapC
VSVSCGFEPCVALGLNLVKYNLPGGPETGVHYNQRKQSFRKLNAFLAAVALEEVLPFDPTAAELAGRIGGELERVGRPIGLADTMIAAIALHHSLELVTGNTAHFQRVQQVGYPLTLVNWRF